MSKSKAVAKTDQKDKLIRVQTIFIIILFGMVVHAHYLLGTYPKEIEMHIPPDLSNGGVASREPLPHEVYAFAYQIWQKTARCEQDCSKEYGKNIRAFGHYFTDSYRNNLLSEASQLESQNRFRIRSIREARPYSREYVEKKSGSSWVVDLQVQEVERIGSKIVRDATVTYPIVVMKYDIDRQKNPWGLAIGGMEHKPVREK